MGNLYESGEMYLETILKLSGIKKEIRSIDVVKEMGFSKPSVSVGMKKLRDGGYINMDKDGLITLTASGKEIATKIYERHQVLSTLLMSLGVSSKTALEDACRIEHDISDETFEAVKKFLKLQPLSQNQVP